MTVGDHFEQVAAVYESLRTTDEAPVRRIGQLLPDRPVTGLDIGCGTGRYSRLLRGLLPAGSLLLASDISAAMLAELTGSRHGHALGVAPLVSAAEQLPVRTASRRPRHPWPGVSGCRRSAGPVFLAGRDFGPCLARLRAATMRA